MAGRILSGFVSLFLLVDGGARLAGFAPYVEGMTKFGYPADLAPWVGLTLLICTVLYIIPRTAVLGAMAWGGLWLRYARLREWSPVMKT